MITSEHESARLRQIFYKATEELHALSPSSGVPKDHPAILVWNKMYEAVRDTEVGLLLYNELVKLRYENAELKNKLSKFNTILI